MRARSPTNICAWGQSWRRGWAGDPSCNRNRCPSKPEPAMPSLSRTEVEQIALLARLRLEDAEIAKLQDELGAILEHFGALAQVDTAGVAPMTHAVPMELAP